MKQPLIIDKNQQISKMQSDLELAIKNLQANTELKKTQLASEINHKIEIIEKDIKTMNSLSSQERAVKFKNAITVSRYNCII